MEIGFPRVIRFVVTKPTNAEEKGGALSYGTAGGNFMVEDCVDDIFVCVLGSNLQGCECIGVDIRCIGAELGDVE
jgi:hypothetical protein